MPAKCKCGEVNTKTLVSEWWDPTVTKPAKPEAYQAMTFCPNCGFKYSSPMESEYADAVSKSEKDFEKTVTHRKV